MQPHWSSWSQSLHVTVTFSQTPTSLSFYEKKDVWWLSQRRDWRVSVQGLAGAFTLVSSLTPVFYQSGLSVMAALVVERPKRKGHHSSTHLCPLRRAWIRACRHTFATAGLSNVIRWRQLFHLLWDQWCVKTSFDEMHFNSLHRESLSWETGGRYGVQEVTHFHIQPGDSLLCSQEPVPSNVAAEWLAFPLRILEVTSSNLGPYTSNYCCWFSYFFSPSRQMPV